MLKFGLICEVDAEKGLAKVHFQDDDVPSGWLPMSVQKSLKDKYAFPFDINEHVWCVMDEQCEYGVIGGAIYDEKEQPTGAGEGKLVIHFADNSSIEYDRNNKTLSLLIKGDVKIIADENVNMECKEATITVTNTATIKAATVKIDAPNAQATGNLDVTGNITAAAVTASGDVKAGAISLLTHKHTAPSGGGLTTPPTP